MSATDLATDPAWFPDRVDVQHRLIRLVRTSHEILRDSAFVDGRTPLGTEPAATRTLGFDAFAEMFDGRLPTVRWIFHEAFCGSTLLARIATIEDVALCLREPQILNDLCDWRLRLPPGQELSLARPDLARAVNAALRPRPDPVARAMQIVAGAHWAQAAILAECCARRGASLEDCTLWFPGMLDDLPSAARRMAHHLQLEIPAGSLDKSIERHAVLHSKNDGQPHDRTADETTNSRVRLEAGEFIQEGLDLLSRLSVT